MLTKYRNSLAYSLLSIFRHHFTAILILLLFTNFAHSAELKLEWDPNNESDVLGYRLYLGSESGNYNIAYDGPDNSSTVSSLEPDRTYYFAVTAYNINGESDKSREISYIIPGVPTTQIISATAGEYGSISPSGSVIVDQGADQTLIITPDVNCHVANVMVDNVSKGAITSYTFYNITENHTISASFALNSSRITASAAENGSIFPTGSMSAVYGSSQKFTISAIENYYVADVVVDGVSVGAVTSYTFNDITDNHTIEAFFDSKTLTISASSAGHGTISPGGYVTVDYGSVATFTITPDEFYQVADVLVDGVSVGAVTYYSIDSVNTNHTIETFFEIADQQESVSDLIIDNGEEGTSFSGSWKVSSCPNPYGADSIYSWDDSGHYAYEADIEGTYTISLWWTDDLTMRCDRVPVEIYDGDILLDTVEINQQADGGRWNELGQYDFRGTARVVILTQSGCSTSADAVWFVADTSVELDYIEIEGPVNLAEESSANYQARAYYTDGTSRAVAADSWEVDLPFAEISPEGVLSSYEVNSDELCQVSVIYTENSVTRTAVLEVTIQDANIAPTEMIIDNGSEGTSSIGLWKVSSSPNPYGVDSIYSWDESGHYAYETAIEETYTLSLWWTDHLTMRCDRAPVEIYDGDILLDTVEINQQANGGRWNEQGQYDFSGTARVVILTQSGCSTGADAVRFVADTAVELDYIEIEGPVNLAEESSANYQTRAYFTDGTSRAVAADSWEVDLPFAEISPEGVLSSYEVNADELCQVSVIYTENSIMRTAVLEVTIQDVNIAPTEMIIDNGSEGTSSIGLWKVSSSPNPYGIDSIYSWDDSGQYAYEADIEGTYTISLWWTDDLTMRCDRVPVEIYDGDILLDTVEINQQANGGRWNEQGQYDFSGTARVVILTQSGCSTGADAVRFD